jgi:hypothetical protein
MCALAVFQLLTRVRRHANLLSAVFHEDYHADGPRRYNAYRTFTFDMASGRRLQLSDLTTSNPLTAIPPLAQPFIETALNQAPPPHDPGTYPFLVDRWTPDKVYSGAYEAWALAIVSGLAQRNVRLDPQTSTATEWTNHG